MRVTDSSGKWLWVAKEFAGDFAQEEGSDEARGGVQAKGRASSETADVQPKEGAHSDDNSNDLPREAAIDESLATATNAGSDRAKESDDNNATSKASGAAIDSNNSAAPKSPPPRPTCCLLS